MGNFILAKKGKLPYMLDLLRNGKVYMQQLGVYRKIEGKVIGDRNEGLHSIFQKDDKSLKIRIELPNGVILPMPDTTIKLDSTVVDHGAYCMYSIPIDPKANGLGVEDFRHAMEDPKMREFGDSLLVVKDTPEFIRRFERAAEQAGYKLEHDTVEYVPRTYSGEMGAFRKLADCYEYQREWRAITDKPIPASDLVLTLGSLVDICMLIQP